MTTAGVQCALVHGTSGDRAALDRQLLDRLVRAAEEAAGYAPLVLVTGGKGPHEECTEAAAMARYLVDRGVPAERIRREERAVNTAENLRFSAALMAAERPGYRCTVVTNGFHTVRSALAARRAGAPAAVLGADGPLAHGPYLLLREAVGTALALLGRA
ncbi:YdcF family protein, partial [Kitasatospora sp. NPDC036755]|uniref:YdcF family protein n=1 Tax=Kitasatospora sp. NPDC036755 TaxID=3154600 RepID=UPI0033D61A21